ncbi:MAG: cell division protein FtsL [Lachnospiraceae bacterium]|nr:cell division protein FtsL [Lachnospiraceae bacterium]
MNQMTYRQGRRTNYNNITPFVQGNTVRRVEVVEERQTLSRDERIRLRQNRERHKRMNLSYVLIMGTALLFVAVLLCNYIQLQSEVTNKVKEISKLEVEYNRLKLANDEELARINSSVDLEEIKAIAIGELGMTYAGEGQIVTIEDNDQDYVHQVADLP